MTDIQKRLCRGLRLARPHRLHLRRGRAAAVDRAQRALLQRRPQARREPQDQPAEAGGAAPLLRRAGPRAFDAQEGARGGARGGAGAPARGKADGGPGGPRRGGDGRRPVRLVPARGVVEDARRSGGRGGGDLGAPGAPRRADRGGRPPGARGGGLGPPRHGERRGAGGRALPLHLRLRAPAPRARVLREPLRQPGGGVGDPGDRADRRAALRERAQPERRDVRGGARDERALLRGRAAAAAQPATARSSRRCGGWPSPRPPSSASST